MRSSPHQHGEGKPMLKREEVTQVTNTDNLGDTSDQFLRSLRTLLLRLRMANQLRQDFVVEKYLVELKDLCRRVCAELGTTRAVFEDLWSVIRQRRGDADSPLQHSSSGLASSLAQDAETVSRAGEVLRSAAAASNRHGFDTNTTHDSCAREVRPSAPSSPSSHRNATDEDEQSSACCSPRKRLEPPRDSHNPKQEAVAPATGAGSVTFENQADTLPLLALAEKLGVGNAVDACLDFIATEQEAVVAAAKKRFSSPETLGMASRAQSPAVDWVLAVQRLAAWSRRGGGVAASTHVQPTSLSSPRGENETKQPSPPSPSLPQGFECSSHFCGLRRAADDQRCAAAVVERSTQCPDDEALDDVTGHHHRTATHRRKRASRRTLRVALESSALLRSESPQTPSTNSPSSSSPPSSRPPPSPRVACMKPNAVACCEARVGVWQERGSGDSPHNAEPCATADPRYCQQAARRRAATPSFLTDRYEGGREDGKVRISSNESEDVIGPQSLAEEDDDTRRDVQDNEPEGAGDGSSEGDDLGERKCCWHMSGDVDNSCCHNIKHSTRAFRASEASTPRPIFQTEPVARTADDDAHSPTCHKRPVRGRERSPRHPSEQWPFASFEGDPASNRHNNESEEPSSQRRRNSYSTVYYDDDYDVDKGGGDVDVGEYNIRPSSGAAYASMRPEDGEEISAVDGEQDDEITCALARKRALLRVRLARQRRELATAVVDANERGLRAERRRRREKKLVTLLMNARRDSSVSSGCAGIHRPMGRPLVREESFNQETGTGGFSSTSVPSVALHAQQTGGGKVATASFRAAGDCRGKEQEEDDDDDDDAVPRKPLRVVPVESSTPVRGSRSGCRRASQKGQDKSEGGGCFGGPNQADSYLAPSFCQVVVWIDALYALEGQRESFHGSKLGVGDAPSTGAALYLVLEDGFSHHRTATRRRHRGTWDVRRAAPRAREGQECRANDRDKGVDMWIFRETVALNVATGGGRGRGRGGERGREETLPGDHDDHDLLLRVFLARSPAVSSCPSPAQRCTSVLQEKGTVAAAEEEVAPDEVVGSVTIPLGRCLATADRGRARNCTFSRPVKLSVVNPEGKAIGWIELGVCGSS